jgi:CRP-like cAMP-binding protein
MREGDTTLAVHVLLRGRAKVVTTSADGSRCILAVRRPGDVLGELSAIDGRSRSASVVALDEVTDLCIPVGQFSTMLTTRPRVAHAVLTVVAGRLRDASSQRTESGDSRAAQRLESLLVDLAAQYGTTDPDGVAVALPFTQDELAASIGASRQTVVRALGKLRVADVVETRRQQVVVLRPDLLARRNP